MNSLEQRGRSIVYLFNLFFLGGFLLADFTLSGVHQPKRGRRVQLDLLVDRNRASGDLCRREIAGNKEMSASYKKRIAKQAGIFPGFTAHKWRQISKIRHMGFSQNGPIYLYLGRFPQKVMDFKRFLGSSEHNFCSCGQQRNGSFQKFASAKLNLDFISSDLGLFKQTRI